MNFPQFSWKRFLLAASISMAVPMVALAVGQRASACGMGPGMEGGKMPPYLRSLNLSEAQRDKVFEIMHGQAPAMRDKAKAARNADEAMRKLVVSPDYSEPKARELADQTAKAMADMSLARAKTERQVYDVLTPEQRKQLADLKASGELPMDGRHRGERGGDHRQPPGH